MRLSLLLLALVGLVQTNARDQSGEAMARRMMVDSRFVGIVSACSTGGTNRNNAAEWLRVAFHDSTSHNAAAGTGGLDASIQFETEYGENGGIAFSSTITQYKFYRQQSVSLADVIALGAIAAVGACGGPMLPFYIGRQDALSEAGEGFVPKPEQSTESHIQKFGRMGFSPEEMISLVACGHTLGGVHASVNPTITGDAYHGFDDTSARNANASFDNHVAVGYIQDTRQNPLAQPYDASFPERSSDTRVYSIDNNATMTKYAASQDAFIDGCNTVLSKMLNSAVPASVSLKGPLTPFPLSATFRLNMQNGALTLSIGSARLYNMVGQWKSFEIGYNNRDGTPGTDSSIIREQAVTTMTVGKPIEVRGFNSFTSFPPSTGVGAITIKVTMNDGSVFSNGDGEEIIPIDDSILIDLGQTLSCRYSGEANNNANGLNVTMAVRAPYNAADRVDLIYIIPGGEKRLIRANFRAARDEYYNYYNVFISDTDALGITHLGAQVTRADGTVSKDTRDDIFYILSTQNFRACVAGAEVPTPNPVPSTVLSRRRSNDRKRLASRACPSGFSTCGERCVDTSKDIEHCGGCSDAGGVDCTALSDGGVQCIQGKCVITQEEYGY